MATRAKVRNLFIFPSTKPIEDAFQRMRVQQIRAQSSTVVSPLRAWHTVVQQGVLTSVHRFNEVDFQGCPEKVSIEELGQHLPMRNFKPGEAASPLPLSSCVTTKKKVVLPHLQGCTLLGCFAQDDFANESLCLSYCRCVGLFIHPLSPREFMAVGKALLLQAFWDTFNAASSTELWPETAFLNAAARGEVQLETSDKVWLSCLAFPGFVIRPKGQQQWTLSLGQLASHGALGWPLQSFQVRGESWLRISRLGAAQATHVNFKWLFTTDPDQWEVQPVAVLSPSHAWLRSQLAVSAGSSRDALPAAESMTGIWLRPDGNPKPLWLECANCGWRGLSVAQIRRVCKELGLEIPTTATESEAVQQAIAKVHGGEVSDDMLLSALKHRVPDVVEDLDVWDTEAIEEAFDPGDLKEVGDIVQKKGKVDSALDAIHALQRALAEKVAVNKAAPPAKKAKKGRKPTISGGDRQYPQGQPTTFTDAEASAYLPDGWKIRRSELDNRWVVRHAVYAGCTRCWTAHGHQRALGLVLKHAWQFSELEGTPCPFPWVTDIEG